LAGFVGASDGQVAVVWMTEAPVMAAERRLCERLGDQRNDGSSKNPIGIRGAAWTVAAGMASSAVNAISTKRVAFSTGDPPLLDFPRARGEPWHGSEVV